MAEPIAWVHTECLGDYSAEGPTDEELAAVAEELRKSWERIERWQKQNPRRN